MVTVTSFGLALRRDVRILLLTILVEVFQGFAVSLDKGWDDTTCPAKCHLGTTTDLLVN